MIFSDKKVYTLIELVVVVIIVSILTRFAFAGFYKARERALLRQAIVELRLIKDAEQAYLLKRSTFTACLNATQCGSYLGLAFFDTANLGSGLGSASNAWSYNVVAGVPYCAYAVRNFGGYAGCTYRFCCDGSNDPLQSAGSCP